MPTKAEQLGAGLGHSTAPGSAEERLIDAAEVAAIIGMRTAYVYARCRRGTIPHLRYGKTLRFRPEAIRRWIVESERGGGA